MNVNHHLYLQMKTAVPTGTAALQSFNCTKYSRLGFTAQGQFCANVWAILCHFFRRISNLLTTHISKVILYLSNKYAKYRKYGGEMEILISNSSDKPIYEQICIQIKSMIMDGTLSAGEALPSMRALAKDLHLSVITVQRAYEDLTRDGFIETVSGKGSFVAAQNKQFIQEEQLRIAEGLLQKVAEIGRSHGIDYQQMANILKLFYEE